ncbi:MAG: APC family permease [Coxiellaceae bacterium]|nr:APC family permease [Coxiellaceae bacterium]
MTLRKDLSRFALLFASVGGIVGSGWLLGPFYTAKVAGPAAILSWAIGGLLMMVIAFTFAELSTSYPVAGGMVRFAQFSHGVFTSFTMAWISWLAAVMVAPIETMAAIQYAGNYFPLLVHSMDGHTSLTGMGIVVAGALMLLMCIINCFAVKIFAKSNSVIVSWKLLIPIITCIALAAHHFDSSNFTQHGGFIPLGWHGVLQALPTAGVIFSFIGYSPAIQLAGEARNPARAVPFAIIGSLLIAIVLYVIIETVFIGALPSSSIAHGWANLAYAGDAGPIAGLVSALGVVWLMRLIYIDAFISPAGTAFIYTASTARINIAMSQNGYMPEVLQKINSHGSPVWAIGINFIVGLIFFLPFPGWQSMVSFIVSCFVLAYAIGPISCAVLRHIAPDVKRPFKVPCVRSFCLVAFIICNLIVYWTGWGVVWKMMITILIGYGLLTIEHHYSGKVKELDMMKGAWIFPYLIGLSIISYIGDFGGGRQWLAFGWDFLVIAIFSAAIFYYALYCGIKNHTD